MNAQSLDRQILRMFRRMQFYFYLSWKIISSPRKTLRTLSGREKNRFYPGLFFTSNVIVLLVMYLLRYTPETGTAADRIVVKLPIVESVKLEIVVDFIGYFVGLVVFSIALKYLLSKISVLVSLNHIVKALCFSSAVFIPIVAINGGLSFISEIFFYDFYSSMLRINDTNMETKLYAQFGLAMGWFVIQMIYPKIWWGYFVVFALNLKKKAQISMVAILILMVSAYNAIIGLAPLIPEFRSIIAMVGRMEDYSEMTDSRNINTITAQALTMSLAIDNRLPPRLRYIYGLNSLAYHLYNMNPQQEATLYMIGLILSNDTDTLETFIEKYITIIIKDHKDAIIGTAYYEVLDQLKDLKKLKDDPKYRAGDRSFGISTDNIRPSIWGRFIKITP